MATQNCNRCIKTLPIEDFGYKTKCGKNTDVLNKRCKICREKERERSNTEEAKQKRKEYKEANKERNKEQFKKWYDDNREANIEKVKQYRLDNIDAVKEREMKYREENRDVILEKKKAFYEANKEQELQRKKEWRENNKEQMKEYYSKHWHEVRKLRRKTEWDLILKHKLDSLKAIDKKKGRDFNLGKECVNELIEGANGRCNWCGSNCKMTDYEKYDQEQWSLDRLDNSFGHIEGNVVLSCLLCNLKRN